jgi:tRNA(Ile)-lysidine synthase
VSGLVSQVEQVIQARSLFRHGERLLVAVSGGLDSTVLLQVLQTLAAKHGWRLSVAHFNHQLRGAASQEDEAFVRSLAAKLGCQFVADRADVKGFARTRQLSLEMAARTLRHEFLARTARRLKCSTVALAHHADDQVELFFLRLLRGAGGQGVGGIKWTSPSPSDPGVLLVRPLLGHTKAALREFAKEHRLVFREDTSNRSRDFLRNRIRAELLPLLREHYQPRVDKTVLRVMEIVGAEADLATEQARLWLTQRRRVRFQQLHPAVQRRGLQIQLLERGIEPDFGLIEQLRAAPLTPVTVSPGVRVSRDEAGEVHLEMVPARAFRAGAARVEFEGRAGEATFDGVRLDWRVLRRRGGRTRLPERGPCVEYFDADKVGRVIHLRHWQPGDRFQPIGMTAPVKLQDFFTNQKVPRPRRHELVLATTAAGEILWIEGLRIGEQFKLDKHSRYCLKWHWQREACSAGFSRVAGGVPP